MKNKPSFVFAGLLALALSPSVFAVEWQHSNSLKGKRVNALAESGEYLFAGTSDSGVFRSSDSGATWLRVNTGLTDLFIRALAARGTYLFAGAKDSGIFRSSDSGANWVAINTGMSSTNIRALAVNDSFLFAGTDGGGVCRSSDSGNHWLAVNKLDDGTDLHFKSIYSFGISSGYVFIGTWGGSAFRSRDNGMTWYLITNGLWDPRMNIIPYSWAVGDTFIFAGTSGCGVVRARDSAGVWFPAATGLPDSAIITALTLYRDTLFAATQKGIFVSSDNGDSWAVDNTGLSDTVVLAFAVSGNQLFAGTNGGGVWRRYLLGMSIPAVPAISALRVTNAVCNAFVKNGYLHYSLPGKCLVSLIAYDARGRSIWNYVSSQQQPGSYHVALGSTPLAAGPYFLRFIAAGYNRVFIFYGD